MLAVLQFENDLATQTFVWSESKRSVKAKRLIAAFRAFVSGNEIWPDRARTTAACRVRIVEQSGDTIRAKLAFRLPQRHFARQARSLVNQINEPASEFAQQGNRHSSCSTPQGPLILGPYNSAMRIAAITAGAAGTFCGSCLHDNTLAGALTRLGHDIALVPTYTPIRTDEADVSNQRVFIGGVNAYLDQSRWTRRRPGFVRWLLDRPGVIKFATKLSPLPNYDVLGDLTLSVLRGEHGHQRAAFEQLTEWLAGEFKPQIVTLTNVLLSAIAPLRKAKFKVPILAYLQGDDLFLDALKPEHRKSAIELIRANATAIDGFIAPCRDYADYMAGYLGIDRSSIAVIPLGLNLTGHASAPQPRDGDRPAIGYFARIAPEKGLHVLVDAFIHLRRQRGVPRARLRVSGFLGPHQHKYLAGERKKIANAGLENSFEHVESPSLRDKVQFLQSLDIFSVPAVFREPKGLYVLEALAHGVPVVQPEHGSFPELIQATGGGRLVPREDPKQLADVLLELLTDEPQRRRLGQAGRSAVEREFTDAVMARRTAEHYGRFVS